MSRHERAGYPAPWHSDHCQCPICTDLRARENAESALNHIRDLQALGSKRIDSYSRAFEKLAEAVVESIPDRRLR